MVLKQEAVVIKDGYDIGIGVDMATGSPMAKGVKGAVSPPEIGGSSGTFIFRRVESTTDLKSSLDLDTEINAGIGLFSISNTFKFGKRMQYPGSFAISDGQVRSATRLSAD